MSYKAIETAATVEMILQGLWEHVVPQRLENIAALSNEQIADLELDVLIKRHGDFTKKICFKTGTLLEQRPLALVKQAIEHNTKLFKAKLRRENDYLISHEKEAIPIDNTQVEDQVISFIQRDCTRDCAIHWLFTDSHSLDLLIESDPLSYFVYACGFVVANHSPLADYSVHQHKKIKDYGERCEYYADYKRAEFEWALQKFILRQMIAQYPIEQIVRINEQMRLYLRIFDARNIVEETKAYDSLLAEGEIYILPAIGQRLEQFVALMTHIHTSIVSHAERKGILQDKKDYDKQAKLVEMYGGYSNFRGQFKPKGLTEHDAMYSGLFFGSESENRAIQKTLQKDNLMHSNGKIEYIDPNKPKGHVAKKGATFGKITIKPAIK